MRTYPCAGEGCNNMIRYSGRGRPPVKCPGCITKERRTRYNARMKRRYETDPEFRAKKIASSKKASRQGAD